VTGSKKSLDFEIGYAGFSPNVLTQIVDVAAGGPAEKAGMKAGDVILALKEKIIYYHEVVEIIEKSPGKKLEFLIDREGEQLTLAVTPRLEEEGGKIGVSISGWIPLETKKYSFFPAIGRSIKENTRLAFTLFNYLKDLIAGEASAKQVGGPIMIAKYSYSFFRAGFVSMLSFMAFISLQLGIINLFPVPVFDGGQILVLGLEGLFRKDFSPKVKQWMGELSFLEEVM
jgi:regulator of sigma E protease